MPNWWDDYENDDGSIKARPKPRTFAERFYDNFIGSAAQTPLGAEAVVRFGTKHGKDKEKLRKAERKVIADYERKQNEDPAWGGRWYPKSQFELAKGVTDFVGGVLGSVDPTMVLAPGRTAVQRIASQVGINAGVDAASQGVEIKRKVRDKYDPVRTGIAAGTGLAVQGGIEYGRNKSLGARVRRGTQQPGWKEVNDVIVKHLEGGGTLKNPKVSPKGAMGPQQVMPETARKPGFGINPWDGKTQEDLARVGRQYSAAMMDKYDGDVAKVLAAYNAGPGRVDGLIKRYGDDWMRHLPTETKNYVADGLFHLNDKDVEYKTSTFELKSSAKLRDIVEQYGEDFTRLPSDEALQRQVDEADDGNWRMREEEKAAIDASDWDERSSVNRDMRGEDENWSGQWWDEEANNGKGGWVDFDEYFDGIRERSEALKRSGLTRGIDEATYDFGLHPQTLEAVYAMADNLGLPRKQVLSQYIKSNPVEGVSRLQREVDDLADVMIGSQYGKADFDDIVGGPDTFSDAVREYSDFSIPTHDKPVPGDGLIIPPNRSVPPRNPPMPGEPGFKPGSGPKGGPDDPRGPMDEQYRKDEAFLEEMRRKRAENPDYRPTNEEINMIFDIGERRGNVPMRNDGSVTPRDMGPNVTRIADFRKAQEETKAKAHWEKVDKTINQSLENINTNLRNMDKGEAYPLSYDEVNEAIQDWRVFVANAMRNNAPRPTILKAGKVISQLEAALRKIDSQVIPEQPVKAKRGPKGLGEGSVATTPVNDLAPNRNVPPPRPPFPGEPGFKSRGGPFGGEDTPSPQRILADTEEALSQIQQVRESGTIPLSVEQLNDSVKGWRKTALQVIKDKSIDADTRHEIISNIQKVVDELMAMQDELLKAPPKAPEAPKSGGNIFGDLAQKSSLFDDDEPQAPKSAKPTKKSKKAEEAQEAPPPSQPPREPPSGGEPPRGGDEGGDGEGGREKYIGSINTERLNLDDDMYEALENTLADYNFDHQTHDQMKAKAAKLLTEKPIDDILTSDPKLSESIEHAIAVRAILHNSLRKEVDLARQINDPSTFSDELVAQQNLQRVRTVAAAEQASGLAGKAGQLLSSFRANVGHSPSAAKILSEMNKLNPARIDPKTYSQMLLDLWNNEEGRVKLAKDSMNVYMEDYIIQTRYAMMLSGIGTHVKNTVETMKVLAQTIAENLTAVPVGFVRGGEDRVRALEAAGRIYGLWRAALNADTYRNAGRSFIEGTPVNKVSKTEGGELLLPFPFNYPQRALASADSFWRGFIELSDIYGMSMRKAASEGLSGREMWDRGEEIAQAAFERAGIYNQARQDLANGKISRKKFKEIEAENGEYHDIITHSEHHAEVIQMLSEPSALTRGFERFKTRRPNMTGGERTVRLAMNLLFPFARVSDRLFFHAVRRSPLFFIDNESMKAIRAGGAERDQVAARVMMGSALLGYYASQAYDGLRTGDGPKDPQKRNAMIAGGWQPNSKFNPETGTYTDATAFATTGIPAGMIATLVERYKAGEIGDEGLWEEGLNLLRQTLSAFKDNTYLEGGGSLFNAIDNTPMADTAWANFWGGMGASFTPAILRQANNAIDPVQRDTTGDRSLGDRVVGRIKAGLPEMFGNPSSDELPEKSDVYGNPIKKDADIGTILFGVGKERQAVTDPTLKEIQRLERTQNNTLVTAPGKVLKQGGVQVKLNAEQFQQYQRLSGQLFVDRMRQEMSTFEYLEADDDGKKAIVKEQLEEARAEARETLFPEPEEESSETPWWEKYE